MRFGALGASPRASCAGNSTAAAIGVPALGARPRRRNFLPWRENCGGGHRRLPDTEDEVPVVEFASCVGSRGEDCRMHGLRHYEVRLRWSQRTPYVVARRLIVLVVLVVVVLLLVVIVRN
jgi:hypothetical protein